jgi:hypothetical protein
MYQKYTTEFVPETMYDQMCSDRAQCKLSHLAFQDQSQLWYDTRFYKCVHSSIFLGNLRNIIAKSLQHTILDVVNDNKIQQVQNIL